MDGLCCTVIQEHRNHQDPDEMLRHPHVKSEAEGEEEEFAQGGFGGGLEPKRLRAGHQEKDGRKGRPKTEAREGQSVHGRMDFHSTFKAHSNRVAISRAPLRVK